MAYPGEYMECRICKDCGQTRYVVKSGREKLEVREDRIPKGLDFMQTPPLYGNTIGHPLYVVSAKAYRVLKEEKIDRALVFEPLKIHEKDTNSASEPILR